MRRPSGPAIAVIVLMAFVGCESTAPLPPPPSKVPAGPTVPEKLILYSIDFRPSAEPSPPPGEEPKAEVPEAGDPFGGCPVLRKLEIEDKQARKEVKTSFRGYPVLGGLEIVDEKSRREIMKAVRDGINERNPDETFAACFWPRHAIHTVEGGVEVDYVICYQCSRVDIFRNGKHDAFPTTRNHQAVLTDRLRAAGIELVPDRP